MRQQASKLPTGHRRALIVMSVLVCLAVASVIFSGWVRAMLAERRQLRSLEDRTQAQYLVDSALRRAAARLAADASYAGEIWRVAPEELAGPAAAAVTIQVRSVSDEPQTRIIEVAADVPADAAAKSRRSKQIKLTLASKEKTP
jgi:Tfp pilus assembly protein PilX